MVGILDFLDTNLDHSRPMKSTCLMLNSLYHDAKFGWNWRSSFDNEF